MRLALLIWMLSCSAVAAQSPDDQPASGNESSMYVEISDHLPAIGTTTTVYLGDRMLLQRRGEYRDCLVTSFTETKKFSLGMQSHTLRAGEPACKSSPDDRNYMPNYPNWKGNTESVYPIRVDRDNGKTVRICLINMGVKSGCFKDVPKDQVKYGPYFLFTPDSVQQTIEYAGKTDNILNFIYAEFVDGMARQAFTREFQIDLTDGNTMAYKGAILEIDEATNATITYRVIRNFRD